jgi:hypothetical protein
MFVWRRSGAQVTLFEAEATCGGHTLTASHPGLPPVDLGFQVRNCGLWSCLAVAASRSIGISNYHMCGGKFKTHPSMLCAPWQHIH